MWRSATYRDIGPAGAEALNFFGFVVLGFAALIARLVYANYKRYEYNTKRGWKVFLFLGIFSIPFFLMSSMTNNQDTGFRISENISEKYSNIRVSSDEITPVVPEYRKATGKPLEVKDTEGNVYHLISSDTAEPHLEVPPGSSVPAPVEKHQK